MKLFGLLIFLASSIQAQAVRTWVSGSGLDSNPCTRSEPCRNFSAAISAVAPSGEVVVLDSAGYGPVTIEKDVLLIAPQGVHAAVAPTTLAGIFVDHATVTIANIFLNSQGGAIGILGSGGVITIENCTIEGFDIGIDINFGSEVYISETRVSNSRNGGIELSGNAESRLTAVLDRISVYSSDREISLAFGVQVGGNVRAVISNSSIARNGDQLWVSSAAGDSEVDVMNTLLIGNGSESGISRGIEISTPAGSTQTVRVSGCLITNHTTGVTTSGPGTSVLLSRGDNTLEGNMFGNTFPATFSPK